METTQMKAIRTQQDLSAYLRGISNRLHHHGSQWRGVVQTLALEFQANLAPGAPLYVRTYNGNMAVQIQFTLRNGRGLKLTYHSAAQRISVRDATTQKKIQVFSSRDNIDQVARKCRSLCLPKPTLKAA
jgi:YD repeat-containing protein